MLSIDDSNDAKEKGIPDFTDDPKDAPLRRPVLALTVTSRDIRLSIRGEPGTVCRLQQTLSLGSPNWQAADIVTLTNDPETLSFEPPPSPAAFWRVQVQ